jgi:hypothetical protein
MATNVEIAEFFGRYATAFSHGQLEDVVSLYSKAFTLCAPGSMMVVSGRDKARQVIGEAMSRYAELGFCRAKIGKLQPNLYASDHAVADLEWSLLDGSGSPILVFDATYVLRKFGEQWKIVLLIAHNEAERLQQVQA